MTELYFQMHCTHQATAATEQVSQFHYISPLASLTNSISLLVPPLSYTISRRIPESTTMASSRILLLLAVSSLLPSVTAFSQPNGAAANKNVEATVASESPQRVFVSTPSKDILRLVSDCMTPKSRMHTLTPHTTCDEAISLLLNRGISGAPVVNPESGKLMGIISSSDFIFKDYGGAVINMEGSSEALANCVEVAQKIVGSTVEELMVHKVMTIPSTEPMAHAADMMARNNLHRLLVVDPEDEQELVGILTRSDVMRDVMTTVRAALPEHGTHDADENPSDLSP